MEYVVINKGTHEQQQFSDVVKVTETSNFFRFTLEHGNIQEFSKRKYEYYSLEVKKKIAERLTNNALKLREDMRRHILLSLTSKEKLVNILNQFFSMGDTDAYWLIRVKSAFAVGTMTIDDFEEFTGETIDELADFIIGELIK